MSKKQQQPTVLVLNPEQQAVADHTKGPLLCPAVAGSGKSTALVGLMKKLLNVLNIPPQRILLVAFNVDAAKSLTKRVYTQVPWLMDSGEVAKTTHSIALRIFQAEVDPNKEWRIDTSGALYTQAIRAAARAAGLTDPPTPLVKHLAARVKNDLVPHNETLLRLGALDAGANRAILDVAEETIAAAKERSGKATATAAMLIDLFVGAESLRTNGIQTDQGTQRFITFDDMLHSAATLLRDNQEIREHWSGKYDFVIVDEAQDLNIAQQTLLTSLASRTMNFVVVGDSSQCVYQWRGAYPDFFSDFHEDFPTARMVRMERNYRSGRRIIDCANSVLDMIPERTRLGLRIKAEREDLGFVNYRVCEDTDAEADWVARNLKQHFEDGIQWKDMAILVRTIAQTKAIEMALLDHGVPAKMIAGTSFFSMRETKIVLAYLRVILGKAKREDFGWSVMYPSRFLGKAFVQKITERVHDVDPASVHDWIEVMKVALPTVDPRQRDAAEQWVQLMSRLRLKHDGAGETPAKILLELLEVTRFRDWIANSDDVEADSKAMENLNRVIDFVAEFTTGRSLLDRLAELSDHQKSSAATRNAVSVSTVHRAKGLEYAVVFIVGMSQGIFPLREKVPEEDRIAYVAITRAKDELWMTRPAIDYRGRQTQPSPYIQAMGLTENSDYFGAQILRAGQLDLLGSGPKS